MICALPFLFLTPPLPGQSLSAEEIMCRVAENQQRVQAARNSYVYDMNVFVRMQRSNGKVAREETRDYVVTPGVTGAKRKLVKLVGRIVEGKQEISYSAPRFKHKNTDVDADIVDSFAKDIMWRPHALGVWVDWFPLTEDRQRKYGFKVEGEERFRDHDVYKVSFQQLKDEDADDCWSGEALIDRHEFQPVLITTQWSCKVPRAVTLILGIAVSHIGAKVSYERFNNETWFPIASGGEMKIRVLFLYTRTIAFSAKNSGFRRTHVETSVQFEGEADDDGPGSN